MSLNKISNISMCAMVIGSSLSTALCINLFNNESCQINPIPKASSMNSIPVKTG
jgi:hypothetical protein